MNCADISSTSRRPRDAISGTPKFSRRPGCPRRAEELLVLSGATLRHGGSKAFFRPDTDEIQLPPPAAFPAAARYYNVALHALTHWTAGERRCNRDLSGRFGDAAYAAEELVAEMGSAYLCARCGIDAGRKTFRFETFGLFNHTNFNNPSATFGTASFGNITGASGNRNIQLGAKLVW